ncbi:MAG: hypothetical protein K2N87_00015 [Eubacterium sp.]|nr:hypothetical protein [Eubacterium sp.]
MKKRKKKIPSMIPLGIAMDYPVNWGIHRIIRDFVQNFYDSIGPERFAKEFMYKWEIEDEPDGRFIHVRMQAFGHAFSYEWLSHIGGSTKTGKSGYAGKYGEGFKIALLCLVKQGGDAVMSSGEWTLFPCEYTEKIDKQRIQMFGYHMQHRKDDGFTTLDLYGIPAFDENVRYVKEALLEFFYPQNELFGDKIQLDERCALYSRSEQKIPCIDGDIDGIFYYKYIARGRLPFPVIAHLSEKSMNFDEDRSRDVLCNATVIHAMYKLAEKLTPKASLWLLTQMEKQWSELPKWQKCMPVDLHTWYYVVCQLVRNISLDSSLKEEFARLYPLEDYAYLERTGRDQSKNRLIREARKWFQEEKQKEKRRRLVNPIFRMLGVSSVIDEYLRLKNTLYRKPDEKEHYYVNLLQECTKLLFPQFIQNGLPEVVLYRECGTEKKKSIAYRNYGISVHVETKTERVVPSADRDRHIRYRVKEAVLEADELSEKVEFQQVLLKYVDACVRMYGTEKSAYPNAVLTEVGAGLYQFRPLIRKFARKWNHMDERELTDDGTGRLV